VTVPERPRLRFVGKCCAAAFEGMLDGGQQHIVAEWLGQELDSSLFSAISRVLQIFVVLSSERRSRGREVVLVVQAAQHRFHAHERARRQPMAGF
jgi:hypothetical protein